MVSVVWRPAVQESIMAEVQGVGSCASAVAMNHERKKPRILQSFQSIPPVTFRYFSSKGPVTAQLCHKLVTKSLG